MESFGQSCIGYVTEGAIWFYEGVKDFVGEDGMVIIQMVAGLHVPHGCKNSL